MPLFSERDHPNTLAAVAGEPDHLWVLLHNLGDVSGHAGSWAALSLRQTATLQVALPRLCPGAPQNLCWLLYYMYTVATTTTTHPPPPNTNPHPPTTTPGEGEPMMSAMLLCLLCDCPPPHTE